MDVKIAPLVSKTQFNLEQDNLLKTILNERFFAPWQLEYNTQNCYDVAKSLQPDSNLEIYITSTCNQACEYCYLYNNKGIYPPDINKKSTILKNLEILLNYLIDNHYHIPNVDLFSGEIWHSSYGLEVLEIVYQALLRGLQVDRFTIPSNCSFIKEQKQMLIIQKYIDKFQELGSMLVFSISIEGRVLEDRMRPLVGEDPKNDEYYERLFTFAKHNEFYFHPMVAAKSAKDWIENHKWWIQQCNDYDMNVWSWVMMLEVRNNDWDDDAIADYLNFLNYLIELKLEECGNSKERFFEDLLCLSGDGGGYLPTSLSPADTFAGCSVANTLTVRLGDLAICPCHRTAYNKYLYGHFVVENDTIVDIVAQNPQMAIKILLSNVDLCNFGCDTCKYQKLCLKGCYGSQLENTGDPFVQVPSVCKFFHSKYHFLAEKYADMGLLEFIDNLSPYSMNYLRCQQTAQTIREVLS